VPSNTTSFNYKHKHLRATCFDVYQSSSGPFNKIIKNTDPFSIKMFYDARGIPTLVARRTIHSYNNELFYT
jgi:hypothetical protein